MATLPLEQDHLISDSQIGFVKGSSTAGAVVSLIDDILKSFVDKEFAQATFCDLSKAYNCVEHSLLLDKIADYGVSESGLKLFESYLKTRRQLVCVGIDKSPVEFVNFGVPQGFFGPSSVCV